MRPSPLLTLAITTSTLAFAAPAHSQKAGSFCFAMASTYYEQLYCEISARGEGASLPAFYQFKNNNEQTQALLLKRPAARIGVEVKPPIRRATPTVASIAPARATPLKNSAATAPAPTVQATQSRQPDCALTGTDIHCDGVRFSLLTNRQNRHLAKGALDADNQMALAPFNGDMQNENQVRDYLYGAYSQYLDAMHRIGLGGVTTSFGKFSYLFYDYHERGIGFEQRFETLYHYLKKDKASLPVSDAPADTQNLNLASCAPLQSRFMVCEHGNRNLVFAAQ
ncbi:hypothetical protein [Simiduia agarivorans]|uniref:Uncharacterized protein n=1 Tax=Simiduia agarivorans (strain DSM 21679 / JCM 13881 / BCRC 17597 / SA1) TaxID=1117647 RepID=K4KGM2_SIMAS|nr:hypothetical protein [Simiduia agarivorans]AFU98234.1 hypothetical protein M5M_05145 [Simiduia agarivorans SA1 = DSM 21679]